MKKKSREGCVGQALCSQSQRYLGRGDAICRMLHQKVGSGMAELIQEQRSWARYVLGTFLHWGPRELSSRDWASNMPLYLDWVLFYFGPALFLLRNKGKIILDLHTILITMNQKEAVPAGALNPPLVGPRFALGGSEGL